VSRRPRITYVRCSRDGDYLQSLEAGGMTVHAVHPAGDVGPALQRVDGVVLAGGPDVDPSLYGESLHPTCSLAGTERDAFELEVARRCLRDGLPLLAICRGLQVLNVAAGGTLVQDIPTGVSGALDHQVTTTPTTVAHEVWVTAGTKLAQLMADRLEGDVLLVNSRHHQAVRKAAPGFVVSATAPDGVIEAIERPDLPYVIGVQWHPENFYRTGEFRALFEGLAKAATSRADRR